MRKFMEAFVEANTEKMPLVHQFFMGCAGLAAGLAAKNLAEKAYRASYTTYKTSKPVLKAVS